jgi:hypothetical protein
MSAIELNIHAMSMRMDEKKLIISGIDDKAFIVCY